MLDIQSLIAALTAQKALPGGVASGGRTLPSDAMNRRAADMLGGAPSEHLDMDAMQGLPDARGPVGIMARGANMYPGGGPAQQGGGQQFGAPGGQPVGALGEMMPARNAVLRRILAQRGGNGLLA